jgi:flagellar basal-body rod protein FlgG
MFQSIFRLTADNSATLMNHLDVSAQNLANVNTPGYKARRFEAYLSEWGALRGDTRYDTTQGNVQLTKRPLDFAIEGPGYFPVTSPDGQVAYTRDGRFTVNREGYLVTERGDLVGDGIQIPYNHEKFLILPDGTVQIQKKGEPEPQTVGRLSLAGFRNDEGLEPVGNNKLLPTEKSGAAFLLAGSTQIKQGMVERSTVDTYSQVDSVMRMNASIIANLRITRLADELYRQSTNLRQ